MPSVQGWDGKSQFMSWSTCTAYTVTPRVSREKRLINVSSLHPLLVSQSLLMRNTLSLWRNKASRAMFHKTAVYNLPRYLRVSEQHVGGWHARACDLLLKCVIYSHEKCKMGANDRCLISSPSVNWKKSTTFQNQSHMSLLLHGYAAHVNNVLTQQDFFNLLTQHLSILSVVDFFKNELYMRNKGHLLKPMCLVFISSVQGSDLQE